MKPLRKIIFWCHLLTAVTAGLVILTMSVTGVLLTYERQIIAWADRRACHVVPAAGAKRLSVETLLNQVRESQAGTAPAIITLSADPAAPMAVGLANGRNVFVNPYTGEVLGEGSPGVRNFFRAVTGWHRWLGAGGENRAAARAVTGACNLGFLFIVLSGFYLWWPRTLKWSQLRNVLWFRRGLPGKARDFNWHNVIGFWSLVPLFIITLSGVVISYPWASNLVYRAVGELPPAPRAAPGQSPGNAGFQLTGLDRLWERAEQQMPGWHTISLRLPTAAGAPLVFTLDQGNGGQPQKRAQLTLKAGSGEVVSWEPFSGYSAGRKLRTILRFAHTGEAGGLAGQTLAGLASAGSAFLVWTGLALAWRRCRAWRTRRAKVAAGVLA
ncbi:MAG TPA: PepSY-associated TM helix domain-containing protein [Blastocatellia bacterium]|nr:PepSY-associated TM helix domain-containing protein [Blastocatellia bacterium]